MLIGNKLLTYSVAAVAVVFTSPEHKTVAFDFFAGLFI